MLHRILATLLLSSFFVPSIAEAQSANCQLTWPRNHSPRGGGVTGMDIRPASATGLGMYVTATMYLDETKFGGGVNHVPLGSLDKPWPGGASLHIPISEFAGKLKPISASDADYAALAWSCSASMSYPPPVFHPGPVGSTPRIPKGHPVPLPK